MDNWSFLKKCGFKEDLVTKVTNFQVDSRLVRSGSVFFAFQGAKNSGEMFLKQVADNQGLAAVISKKYQGGDFNLALIRVDNPFTILQELAKDKIGKSKGKKLAITGSVGKSTTKEFVYQLLLENYVVAKTPGNANSQIGVPLSILNFEKDYDIYVLEMGMSKKGHIQKLTEVANPDIALITKISYSHSENFKSLDEIASAKAEIFTPQTKIKIVDYDLLRFSSIKEHQPLTFSISCKDAFIYYDLNEQAIYENGRFATKLDISFQETSFIHNTIAAVSLVRQLGLGYADIKNKVPFLKPPKMRFEKLKLKNAFFINDTYNSSPLAVHSALENIKNYQTRKIAILGEMLELGEFSEKMHHEIGDKATKCVDILFTLGKKTESTHRAFLAQKKVAYHFLDLNQLAEKLKNIIKADDVVLVKASRSIGLEKLFELI
jgi:UDP-N-acetylmuramoyl-tripeptide--D-alanyl-D-alanine ligase